MISAIFSFKSLTICFVLLALANAAVIREPTTHEEALADPNGDVPLCEDCAIREIEEGALEEKMTKEDSHQTSAHAKNTLVLLLVIAIGLFIAAIWAICSCFFVLRIITKG
jgi:hypothetical protein